MTRTLILASQSPRRVELLRLAGYQFQQLPVQISEIPDENLNPELRIRQLARMKAEACLEMRIPRDLKDFGLVSADTLVVLDGKSLGKPKDEVEACQMLRRLSGRTHQVITSLVLYDGTTKKFYAKEAVTEIEFRELNETDIQDYVATGDPMDKAGAYGIQSVAERFIQSRTGSYDNVVGFPLEVFEDLRREAGLEFHSEVYAPKQVAVRLQQMTREIKEVSVAAERNQTAVQLVAVSKLKPAEAVIAAMQSGQLVFGENYVQEAVQKQERVAALLPLISDAKTLAQPRWHFIGQLQSNKVKDVVGRFDCIHSVDRLKLAKEISKHSVARGLKTRVLIQVNIGDEDTKAGVGLTDAKALVHEVRGLPGLEVGGLMCMPPLDDSPERYFAQMQNLFQQLKLEMDSEDERVAFRDLSMGTTHDYRTAIAFGATLVRLGTAIFGERT